MLKGYSLTIVLGACILLASFFGTLWFLQPKQPVSGLESRFIFDIATLNRESAALGLMQSNDLKGNVDEIKRDGDQVTLSGWAANLDNKNSTVTIHVFAQGRDIFQVIPKGRRPDVARAFPTSSAASGDVQLRGQFSCSSRDELIIVAVSSDRRFNPLNPLVCP